MDPEDRCIAAASLLSGHALSYADQPYFHQLIEVMRKPVRPLVVLAGAGLSMGAGLPSWRALVEGVENELVPPRLKGAFKSLNSDDLERRSDLVLFMSGDQNVSAKNVKHIRSALYRDKLEPEPSALAEVVAQLASVYPQPVSVLTTNFDEVLESAMSEAFEDATSFSFKDWDSWSALPDASHRSSIMHLHGLIYSDDRKSLGPLVLSESDFRVHGPEIQKRLAELFRLSDVLIVGASLADRNIATPLALSQKSTTNRFAVLTPTLTHDEVDSQLCAEVAVWQAEAMQQALGVKPLLLKCHSQVPQVLTECTLAARHPREYRRPGGGVRVAESLHYGTRFPSALKDAYVLLGASPKTGSIPDGVGIDLSKRLNELTLRRDGPHARLKQLRQRYRGRCADTENLGVFVWLRDLPNRADSEFGLRLVTTSAYAHWTSWSAFRVEPIQAGSPNAAVQAAYGGRQLFVDVPRSRHSGSWQGAWAQPLVAGYTVSDVDIANLPIDQLLLGAVAVNTDRKVTSDDPDRDAHDLSVLVVLSQDEMTYFREAVDALVEDLFA